MCLYEKFRGPACCERLYYPAGMQHMPDKLWRKLEVVSNERLYPVVINTDYVKRCVFGWRNTWFFIGVNSWYQVGLGAVRRINGKTKSKAVIPHRDVWVVYNLVISFDILSHKPSLHCNLCRCIYHICVLWCGAAGCFPTPKKNH